MRGRGLRIGWNVLGGRGETEGVNTPVRAPWATKAVALMLPARISMNARAWIAERAERARRPRPRLAGRRDEGGGINTACTDIDECVGVDCGAGGTCSEAEGETEAGQYTCVRRGLRRRWDQHGLYGYR